MAQLKELPNIITTEGVSDARLKSIFRGIQQNFDHLIGGVRAEGERLSGLEGILDRVTEEPDDVEEEKDPTKVLGARWHDFWRERRRQQVQWFGQARWDELALADFPVTRYKIRVWEWDANTGDRAKYKSPHPKAGEYKPPRSFNVSGRDVDSNTYAETEIPGLIRHKFYTFDVRAIGKDKKGPWSDLAVPGTPFDTTPPPAPTAVYLDVDAHAFNVDCDQPVDPLDFDAETDGRERHPDIAYSQFKIVDSNGNTVVKPNGKKLFDPHHSGERKRFRMHRPRGNYRAAVRNVDGSGNKSAWVFSPFGNKKNPPTPTSAPSVSFDEGGRRGVRMIAGATYGQSFTDDDIVKMQFRAYLNGRYRYAGVPMDEGTENSYYETNFKGSVKEGTLVLVDYRVRDKKSNWSGWSPTYSTTAYDVVGMNAPSFAIITQHRLKALLDWGRPSGFDTLEGKAEISHYEWIAFISGNESLIVDSDLHCKKTKATIQRARTDAAIQFKVRAISKGGTASSYTYSGSAGSRGVQKDELESGYIDRFWTQNSYIDNTWLGWGGAWRGHLNFEFFAGGAYGSAAAGTQNIGDVNAGTITGALIRTASSGARVVLSDPVEGNASVNVYGTSNLRGKLQASDGDFNITSHNGADIKFNPAGFMHFIVASVPATAGSEGGFMRVVVNGVERKIKLFAAS